MRKERTTVPALRRVVVTGLGAITPLGLNVQATWQALIEGRHGIRPLEGLEGLELPVHVAAQVRDFEPENWFSRKEASQMDRFVQFARVAAAEALQEHADLPLARERIGVIVGSGVGGIGTLVRETEKLLTQGSRAVSPRFIPMMISDMAAGELAIQYGFTGANFVTTSACASSAHAIGEAFRAIRYGFLDACLTGGSEAPITPVAVAGFANMRALSRAWDADAASLPFDRRRSGFVIGEGAVMLFLESRDGALRRGAPILGEILGYGATADAFHITSPDPEGKGAARAMTLALQEAGLTAADVDYVNAHGTGTPLNDVYETLAIKTALGKHAYEIPISSTKGASGHLLGAAGAIEVLACLQAMQTGILPPTVGLLEPDEALDLDYVPVQARRQRVGVALSNSLGFGGHNASLCLGTGGSDEA